MKSAITTAMAVLLCVGSVSALGAGDAAAGKTKSETCAACHGPDGNGDNPAYPKLAGQYASYIVQALRDYQSGKRKNAIMAGFAGPLSEQDMDDLAAFFASQSGDLRVLKAD